MHPLPFLVADGGVGHHPCRTVGFAVIGLKKSRRAADGRRSLFGSFLGSQLLHPFASYHAGNAENHEGDAQQLAHVKGHAGFEGHLDVLGELDEEAEGEDGREAEAKEEARAHLLLVSLVEPQADEDEEEVGEGLVELTGMARHLVDLLEDEGPGHIGHLTDDFAVHQVAQADEAGCGGRGDGDVVEYLPEIHVRLAIVEPERYHESEGATVGGQTLIARELPAHGGVLDGQEHLDDVVPGTQKIVGLVEEAVTQTCPDDDAKEAVDEEGVEIFVLHMLILIEPLHHEVGQKEPYKPAQRIPAHAEVAEMEGYGVRVPDDE